MQMDGAISRRSALLLAGLSLISRPVLADDSFSFDGSYSDPKHPGCARNVMSKNDNEAEISGVDGNPGCSAGNADVQKPWRLNGKVDGKKIFVDFSPKGGPKDLLGNWEDDGIRWPDNNKWTKITQKTYPQDL
ncbi:hypothetical protein GUITHDRAFT_152936 [Guillardia theta CCMP2712]|uniref:Secreted protein n=1 Tax=Guillardia theta (strain CCMP2712) TaxID=905079 RepID=L1J9B1_GUITC|nr:hypothetical protein GUITHDRAFT_152936 [Guillardia theta CCMP2712]EKX44660.1 hypothetical protein GUITHDRAFT_152936 [Guillardia theta CCMP2712]|eukprot:XP_005831640.1 hypothetical protein GUITHDRAFT_152936 [Guillardia theta CCMP2712]